MKTVSIIGAGPVGNYLALLLSDKFDVEVYEEHKEIGKPVQCAGIVTSEFAKIIKPNNEFVINKTNRARVFAPDGSFLEIKVKPNHIIDRAKFDSYLYKKAKKSGVKFHLGKKLSEQEIKKLKSDYIIGADGPLSKTASAFGFKKNKLYHAIQARIEMKNDDAFEFYPYIKDFAWVVPENKNIVRLGIASRKNTKRYFEKFIKKFSGKVLEIQSGLIPIYDSKTFQKGNVFLVGDAAAQVKVTTGGGLVPGLKAAKELSIALKENKDYNKLCKPIKNNLQIHLIIRKVLNQFSDKDWEYLIKLCNQERIKRILFEDRENPSKLMFKLILNEPRFFKFSKYVNTIFIKK
jgi:digeranylgeranylglycerophospholipid reductase